jgi:hypothetical protein
MVPLIDSWPVTNSTSQRGHVGGSSTASTVGAAERAAPGRQGFDDGRICPWTGTGQST